MAFNPLTSTEIETGKPVSNTTASKVKDNFDDHEERLQTVEAGGATAYPPIILRVNGYYGDQGAAEAWLKTVVNFNLTITGVRLYIDVAGSAGTTTIDLQVKSGANPYDSIFTTLPSVVYTAGDDAVSSNAVLDPTKVDLLAGDIIRLDTTSVQTNGRSFMVRIDYVKEA